MDIEIVEAKDRFSVVHFGAGTGDMFTQYHCPKCGEITTVSDDLSGEMRGRNSTISTADHAKHA